MKKMRIVPALLLILIFTVFTGCTSSRQTIETFPAAVESSTAQTTLIEIPSTETVQEDKVASNFELLYVPKITTSLDKAGMMPWFDTIRRGLEQCAKDYGFKVTVTGPPKFDAVIQTQIVLDSVGKNIDAVIANPIDEKIMDSAFERLNKANILAFSNEGMNLKNVVLDMEAMSGKTFGENIIKSGLGYAGQQGKYLVSVGSLTSSIQKEWADAEIAYQKQNAPSMVNVLGTTEGTDRFEDNEDIKIAGDKLTGFFDGNKDIKLVIGNSETTSIAAGDVIARKKLIGKLTYIGVGLPIAIGDLINDGIIQESFFWDPYDLGYAMGYIALQTWLGNIPAQGSSVVTPSGEKLAGYENLQLAKNSSGADTVYGNATVSVKKDNLEMWKNKFGEYGWPK
jgi:simple sugar transport system substrate-binding protein